MFSLCMMFKRVLSFIYDFFCFGMFDNLKKVFLYCFKPLVRLKMAKSSLELHLGTIPVGLGWVRV